MARIREAAGVAHRTAVTSSASDMAAFLQDALGQKLVAYMVGISDEKAVGAWAKGSRAPRPDTLAKLRAVYQVFRLLSETDSPHTVRAWFIGMNPQLGDESPAEGIRAGREREVWSAAKSFVANG